MVIQRVTGHSAIGYTLKLLIWDRINSANNNLLIIIAYYMPTVQIAHFYILCKGTSTIKNNLMQH